MLSSHQDLQWTALSKPNGPLTWQEIADLAMKRKSELDTAAAMVMGTSSTDVVDLEPQTTGRSSARYVPDDLNAGSSKSASATPQKIVPSNSTLGRQPPKSQRGAAAATPQTSRIPRGKGLKVLADPKSEGGQALQPRPRSRTPTSRTELDAVLLRGGTAAPVQNEAFVAIDSRSWVWGCGPYEVNKLTGVAALAWFEHLPHPQPS